MSPKQETVYIKALELFKIDEEKKSGVKSLIGRTYDIDYVDYTDDMIRDLVNDLVYTEDLFKKCIMPPFSVLDTKQGDWRERKMLLDEYLGESTIGRKEGLAYGNMKVRENDTGTSQFDSVLAELCLKWFGVPDGLVFDPFAGGHIRGTMASLVGMRYIGIDLNKEQIDANIARNYELRLPGIGWHHNDSLNSDLYIDDNEADLIFSCPPYGDLEKYTEDPRDLSNMEYDNFKKIYFDIIKKCCLKLKEDRFAVFVVGDFRDDKGFYRGFVKDTIIAFQNNGVKLYNELVLLNNIGTAPMRSSMAFRNRKMVKLHQNVLIFFKGDPKTIQANFGKIESRLPIPTRNQSKLF